MWGFYFEQLVHSIPFFLKGLWMTVAVSGLSLVAGTVIGFAWGIIRAGKGNVGELVQAERAYATTQEELDAARAAQADLAQRVAVP